MERAVQLSREGREAAVARTEPNAIPVIIQWHDPEVAAAPADNAAQRAAAGEQTARHTPEEEGGPTVHQICVGAVVEVGTSVEVEVEEEVITRDPVPAVPVTVAVSASVTVRPSTRSVRQAVS